MTVIGALVAAGLVVAQEQHRPPAGAHFALLAGIAVAALVVLGVRWWRRRHEASKAEPEPKSHDGSPEQMRSPEEQPPRRQP